LFILIGSVDNFV